MLSAALFLALAAASALGTVWVYWGVPQRVVAIWAVGVGTGFAALNAILWLFFTGIFDAPRTWRIAGGVAIGLGIATGGVVARALHRFNWPTRQDGP